MCCVLPLGRRLAPAFGGLGGGFGRWGRFPSGFWCFGGFCDGFLGWHIDAFGFLVGFGRKRVLSLFLELECLFGEEDGIIPAQIEALRDSSEVTFELESLAAGSDSKGDCSSLGELLEEFSQRVLGLKGFRFLELLWGWEDLVEEFFDFFLYGFWEWFFFHQKFSSIFTIEWIEAWRGFA